MERVPGDVDGGELVVGDVDASCGGIGHVIGSTVGKLAVTAFDAIVHALFEPIAHFINTQLIGWLIAVPDYAPPGSHVAATQQAVLAMAGAALVALAMISVARFWAAGLAGSGGSAVEGLARTVGAALPLPIWLWLFHTAVALANDASTGLPGSESVTNVSANLLAVGVGGGSQFGATSCCRSRHLTNVGTGWSLAGPPQRASNSGTLPAAVEATTACPMSYSVARGRRSGSQSKAHTLKHDLRVGQSRGRLDPKNTSLLEILRRAAIFVPRWAARQPHRPRDEVAPRLGATCGYHEMAAVERELD